MVKLDLGAKTTIEDYLLSMPEPRDEYDCLVTGLVLVFTAQDLSEFEQAKSIVLEVSPLVSADDQLKALDFVKKLLAQSFLGL